MSKAMAGYDIYPIASFQDLFNSFWIEDGAVSGTFATAIFASVAAFYI